jgi:hypothetical protein
MTTTSAQTQRFTLHVQDNNDNGSLKVGVSAGNKIWAKGDKIQIEGEGEKIRTVTFVMGSGEKTHLCFAKQGPVAKGQVDYRIVSAETALPPSPVAEEEMSEADLEAATQPVAA